MEGAYFSRADIRGANLKGANFRALSLDYNFLEHGASEDGLILEDETGNHKLVNTEALANLFKLFSGIECIILNACYSEAQATAIVEYVRGRGGDE